MKELRDLKREVDLVARAARGGPVPAAYGRALADAFERYERAALKSDEDGEGGARVKAAVAAFDDDDRLLLGLHDGEWALPGGHVDEGELVAAAALRELGEEAGLSLEGEPRPAGAFEDPEAGCVYFLFVGRAAGEAEAGSDLSEVDWLDPRAPSPEWADRLGAMGSVMVAMVTEAVRLLPGLP